MKIGIIAHLKHPITIPFKGGLEAFTYQITNYLVKSGHEVMLFASSGSSDMLPLVPILSDDHYDHKSGIRTKMKDLPSEYIAEHHAYHSLMSTIDDYKLDVIFNNSLHYIPITMAGLVKTPMLTVLHTPPFYELGLAIAQERKNPVINYVTVSKQSAKTWKKLVDDCEVIPNGIEIDSWKFYDKSAIEEYAVWFGRIHPDKGLHLAITAAKLAGIKLKVAGGIADQKYFDNQVVPILDDSVELLGLCNHEELNVLIGNATVCVVTPTWEEPFGLVLAEAMACGTPIAGFRIGALPEVVVEGTGFLVNASDTAALVEAIKQAKTLDRSAIRRHAEEHFEITDMVKQYEDLLAKVSGVNTIAAALEKIAEHAKTSDNDQIAPEREFQWLQEAGALKIVLPGESLDFNKKNMFGLLTLLKNVGKANLSVGRIFEGHINALYLVHLYASPEQKKVWFKEAEDGILFGIWNTQAADGIQIVYENSLILKGSKTFCSGARIVKRALITGNIDHQDRKGWQMMIVDMNQITDDAIDSNSWKPMGMKASGSYRVDFSNYHLKESELLEMPGTYLKQPYFNGGAIRFAAVQLGGAESIVTHTINYLNSLGRTDDPFQKVRLANMLTQLQTGLQWLEHSGNKYDQWVENPDNFEDLIAYANMTRVVIEEISLVIMSESNRCVGARGLMAPYELERLNRDLTFYLRQPAPDATRMKIAEHFINKYTNNHATDL
jgi:glycosyltransferase involved in cell wall biosynthesis/alkylation response protein AidB-like acyl-CoA dehydrogenase